MPKFQPKFWIQSQVERIFTMSWHFTFFSDKIGEHHTILKISVEILPSELGCQASAQFFWVWFECVRPAFGFGSNGFNPLAGQTCFSNASLIERREGDLHPTYFLYSFCLLASHYCNLFASCGSSYSSFTRSHSSCEMKSLY